MKIKVYFSLGDVLECEDVKNSRKFWRLVSKHCKRMSAACKHVDIGRWNSYDWNNNSRDSASRRHMGTGPVERVVRVIKEV